MTCVCEEGETKQFQKSFEPSQWWSSDNVLCLLLGWRGGGGGEMRVKERQVAGNTNSTGLILLPWGAKTWATVMSRTTSCTVCCVMVEISPLTLVYIRLPIDSTSVCIFYDNLYCSHIPLKPSKGRSQYIQTSTHATDLYIFPISIVFMKLIKKYVMKNPLMLI